MTAFNNYLTMSLLLLQCLHSYCKNLVGSYDKKGVNAKNETAAPLEVGAFGAATIREAFGVCDPWGSVLLSSLEATAEPGCRNG